MRSRSEECGMWNVEGGMWNEECGRWNVEGEMKECNNEKMK